MSGGGPVNTAVRRSTLIQMKQTVIQIIIISISVSALLPLWVSANKQVSQRYPRFEDYPVKSHAERGPSASIYRARDISSAEEYAQKVRAAAKEGPNFAGHYAIVTSSCGMICVNLSILNIKTGKIYEAPFGAIGDMPCSKESQKLSEIGIDYRLNSRLLIVKGHFETYADREDSGCSTRYYLWRGNHFVLIHKIPSILK
jgi:hypothetical protein